MKLNRKFFLNLHLWLSLPFGLVVAVTCFTGAMLVFEDELTRAVRPEVYEVTPAGQPLDVGALAAGVAATLPDGVEVTGVTVGSSPDEAWRVNLSRPKYGGVMVNQYTGEVLGDAGRLPFFSVMFRLHRWLMDSRDGGEGIFWGKVIVGASTLAFVVVLVTGVIVWWPRTVRALRRSLQIPFRHGAWRLWRGVHVAGGMYALVLLFAMAVTGLTWSFPWWRTGFYALFGVETQQVGGRPRGGGNGGHGGADGAAYASWQKALDTVSAVAGDYSRMTVSDGRITVSRARWGNVRGSDTYTFDTATGEVTGRTLYADQPDSGKMRGWIYSVHTGHWGGMVGRVLSFLAALLGAALPLTGYYLWIKRLARR